MAPWLCLGIQGLSEVTVSSAAGAPVVASVTDTTQVPSPIWGESTRTLAEEFIASGSHAVIVTARAAQLDESWLGRPITRDALRELEQLGVDPCGEYGEYHTLVTCTSLFSAPLDITMGVREMHGDCWALDVSLSKRPLS